MKNNIVFLVFKKELLDMFRDKKTVIMSIIIPLVIIPILFTVMGKGLSSTTKEVENNLTVAVTGDTKSSLGQFLKGDKSIKLVDSGNLEEDVKSGKILVGVDIPENFDSELNKETPANVSLVYDNSSQASSMAMSRIGVMIDAYSKQVVSQRLAKRNIDVQILTPIQIVQKTAVKEAAGTGKLIMAMILPMLLVLYSITGPMAPAVDLGAGEKERGTLEPLLTTQAGRMSLLWGKFLAITVMGIITAIASMAGIIFAFKKNASVFSGGSSGTLAFNIDPKTMILIVLISILTTMVFGALYLAMSIYARSFKEAQTYLSPIMIIAFIPTYGTYLIDAKNIKLLYFNIPIANSVCLLKEFMVGIFNYTHIFLTFGWMIVYILISVLFARYMFGREEVIFRT